MNILHKTIIMRKILILILITSLISCSRSEKNDYQISQKVIITGKIDSINTKHLDVKLYINRLGHDQLEVYTKADSLGNFHASFETYTPTDVWLQYKTNILLLVHPGDSIYVRLNGKARRRPAILKTIEFSGDAAKINQDAAKFQLMYFSNTLYNNWDAKKKAIKEYNLDQYVIYLDSLKQKADDLYTNFVNEVNPDKEVQVWAKTYIEQDYYNALSWYPGDHLRANNLKRNEWSVPDSYYDSLLSRLPITQDMFISGYALSGFINRFHYHYSRGQIWNEEQNKQYKTPEGYLAAPAEIMDSLVVYGILKYTPDTLLRQMVLTEFFSQRFDKSELVVFEKYRSIVDKYIQEPFLIEPLIESYTQVKDRIENPKIASNAYLEKLENSSANQIFDSILNKNNGKVIYLDCWATWCGPCKAEMPRSKKLMEKMKNKDVAFVFLCIDSEEKLWKANLAELQIGGQHYYLNQEQSTDLRKIFEVRGIPHYFLINKEGVIVEKGSHLRPDGVNEKIEKLLEE